MTELFLTTKELNEIVREIAVKLNYQIEFKRKDKIETVILCVMNGSFMFFSDLMKQIKGEDIDIDSVKASSYFYNAKGHVQYFGLDKDLEHKHICIVEDIIDSGDTIKKVIRNLDDKDDIDSITVVSLLARSVDSLNGIKADHIIVGKYLDNDGFVWGYGLDDNEKKRNTNSIFIDFKDDN